MITNGFSEGRQSIVTRRQMELCRPVRENTASTLGPGFSPATGDDRCIGKTSGIMKKSLKLGLETLKTVFILLKTISRLPGGDFHFFSPVEAILFLDRTVDQMMGVHLNPDFGKIQVEQKGI